MGIEENMPADTLTRYPGRSVYTPKRKKKKVIRIWVYVRLMIFNADEIHLHLK